MDTITHSLLGATIGQAFFKKRLGPKATGLGALAAALPDLDVLVGSGVDQVFTFHRSYTHALPVEAVAAGLFALALVRWQRTRSAPAPYLPWFLLFLTTLFSHALLDWCTSYGVMLMLPFTWHRYAVNCVAVLDVFFTGSLIVFLIGGWLLTKFGDTLGKWQQQLARLSTALFVTGLVIGYGLTEESRHAAQKDLVQRGQMGFTIESYPTLFQPILRQLIAQKDQVFLTAYRTWWEPQIHWTATQSIRRPEVTALQASETGKKFLWFTSGKIKAEAYPLEDGKVKIRLTDMRYLDPLDKTTGMWGIEGVYDQGKLVSPITFSQRRKSFKDMKLSESWALIRKGFKLFWNRTFYGAPL